MAPAVAPRTLRRPDAAHAGSRRPPGRARRPDHRRGRRGAMGGGNAPVRHRVPVRAVVRRARRQLRVPGPPAPQAGARGLGQGVILKEPVGVVAAITPFNFPLYLNLPKVLPALAMGNTVVLKPSPYTPLEAFVLGELADAAELPPGVLRVVTGHVGT